MKKFFTLIVALLLIVSINYANAQTAVQLKVGTGGANGTYSTMFKEMANACINDLILVEQNSSGSVENIENLLGNKINAAFTQADVLRFKANTEDLSAIKTLIVLHPEEVHFIAKRDSGLKAGGVMGIGGKDIVFDNVLDLGGFKVGAAGGSYITAQVIRLQTEIPYQVVRFENNNDLIKALQTNQVQAAVMVGGAPMPIIDGLTNEFKLLSINEATATKLKNVYNPARVSYSKMGASGVPTVSVDAMVVTREYKTVNYVNALNAWRQCVMSSLDNLKEVTGTHPKWQAVTHDNKGKWAYWEAPPIKK